MCSAVLLAPCLLIVPGSEEGEEVVPGVPGAHGGGNDSALRGGCTPERTRKGSCVGGIGPETV